jgi:site-specific DNA recombinase
VQTFPYGYLKPPGAASDADIARDPLAEPVYEEWFRRLEAGGTYAEVADWLNAARVAVGRWERSDRWTVQLVAHVTRNPILKGFRRRNHRKSKRVNKSGGMRSVKAPPEERLSREVPHLRFIEPARYDRLIAALDVRNGACSRGRKDAADTRARDVRAGVSRKRTAWPGQHVVCGRIYYWGGHGDAGRMMCSGVRSYQCWNSATFDGATAARRLAEAVLGIAESLPDFDEAFLARVEAATGGRRTARDESLRRLALEIDRAGREIGNIVDAIASHGLSGALGSRLAVLEAAKARLEAERDDLVREADVLPPIPPASELRRLAREEVGRLDFAEPEFGRLMHRLAPRIEVFPHEPFDGGKMVLRAVMQVDLAGLLGAGGRSLGGLIKRSATVDLFDPPQWIAYLERVVGLCARGLGAKAAAAELGLTATAAQRAIVVHRSMQAAGASDPYLPVLEPPAGECRLGRAAHHRYRFEPLDGYPAWPAWDLARSG